MQFHGNSFARIESDWTFTDGGKSLSNKQHFMYLTIKLIVALLKDGKLFGKVRFLGSPLQLVRIPQCKPDMT